MNERYWELKCVVSHVKHLAFWILGFSWLTFKVTTLQTSKMNLSTAPLKIGNPISCSLCVSDTFTLWCELQRVQHLKTLLWQPKSEIPFLIIHIYMQNLQQSIKPPLYTTGIVCVNVSDFLHMWNHCWFYICICIIRCTLNMQNFTYSYDEKLQLVHHLKYLNP
jgi:hypothetical protein